jgi:alkanesulfonate monooxygenase SsuD/methylene tetrahydromethanopterin reductase-like flavin-dependent oxidoreductase (luciferase family)
MKDVARQVWRGENMEFGVFDHLDRYGGPLADYYEDRLRIVEAYDRAGFYAYHLAEHHSTPLGMAPSPSVFLTAVAQRTKRLRFGPLVWAMPLHHPLRLIEEICMLDQLSGGRLEIGFGRGSVPIELEYYGANPDEAQDVYAEAVEVVLKGLTQKVLDFEGKRFSFHDVPMEIEPLQKPHPPIWYGVHMPDSAERAARRNLNVVSLDPPKETRLSIDRYRSIWPQVYGHAVPFPKLGLGRFIVVAPTDAEAMALARRAYLLWHASFTHLFRRHGRSQSHPRPATFDLVAERGQGVAGSPSTVAKFLSSQLDETGCNYVVGQFAFGDLTLAESLRSIGLFASDVMPVLRNKAVVNGEEMAGVAVQGRG